jgi:hypothetical protein
MGKIHAGATLTPHFREFLPAWVADQPWYSGTGALRPIGFFRFEDPAGEVGVETHLLHDGQAVYHVPLTYRAAPPAGGSLVSTAEHSVLGTRWIYDAVTDPVWIAAVLDLVATGGEAEPAARTGFDAAGARGVLLRPGRLVPAAVRIDVDRRIVVDGSPEDVVGADRRVARDGSPEDAVGLVTGFWHQDGEPRTGRLAVIRQTGPNT